MELLGGLVLVVLLWFGFKAIASGYAEGRSGSDRVKIARASRPPRREPTDQEVLDANMGWLRERWDAADVAKASANFAIFPKWFFDPPTERQLARLQKMGIHVRRGEITKGTASDIIGLFGPIEDHTKEVLEFFKQQLPRETQNEARARHAVAKLLADPANAHAWEERPADAMQREFLRFFDMKIPAKVTHKQATTLISEIREQKTDAELDEWNDFESVCDELSDPETLRDYGLKRPSLAVIRDAVKALRKSDAPEDASDPLAVSEKIIEMKPELQRV
jgi:hypothetical protein